MERGLFLPIRFSNVNCYDTLILKTQYIQQQIKITTITGGFLLEAVKPNMNLVYYLRLCAVDKITKAREMIPSLNVTECLNLIRI
jgi:hypothetical protein